MKKKEIEKAKSNLMRQIQCEFHCGDGDGKKITKHYLGCYFFVSAFPPCDYSKRVLASEKGGK